MTNVETPPITEPDNVTLNFVKVMLGAGVWVVVGLAPLLGTKRIPFFAPLIDLYPESIRFWLIPVSGFMMGMISVIVAYAASKRVDEVVGKWFRRAAITFGVTLILLVVAYMLTVVHVVVTETGGATQRFTYVTGSLTVPAGKTSGCTCEVGSPAQECVEGGTSDSAIRACFGPYRVAVATLVLALLYLVVTASFAAAAGLRVITAKDAARAEAAQPQSPPSPRPPVRKGRRRR